MPSLLLWLISQARRIPIGWWHFLFDAVLVVLLVVACKFRRLTVIEIALVADLVLHHFRAIAALYNSPAKEDD